MQEIQSSEPNVLTEGQTQKPFGFWLMIIALLFVLTQVARLIVLQLGLPVFFNDKFAFSINFPSPLMYTLYLVAMTFIGNYLYRNWSKMSWLTQFAFVLIVTGGVSNFIERIFAGKVVDYIFIANGVLNIADLYIFVGIILIFVNRQQR
ncbi:MAG TPA: signal peptidase II [Candidatus Doudnabacteria bacterium]|nr:signal peptidase II [Candidatus Doudnabacteria bacterium]